LNKGSSTLLGLEINQAITQQNQGADGLGWAINHNPLTIEFNAHNNTCIPKKSGPVFMAICYQ
jgi:hypothetical protein